jgi:hypothetical protein
MPDITPKEKYLAENKSIITTFDSVLIKGST